MKYLNITLLVLTLFVALPVEASKRVHSSSSENCKMVETAQIGVNFNNVPIELKSSRGYVEQKSDEILAVATDIGIKEISVNNMNYNVYTNNGNGCNANTAEYKLNGNISFKLGDTDKVMLFMDKLGEKGYKVNFNMNAYRQCQ